jgi:hypothetical protein
MTCHDYIVVHISRQRDILIAPSFTAARDYNTRREERRLCWANQNDKNHNLLLGRNANQCLDYGMSRSLHLKVKVSEYRKGTKQLTIHRNCQFTVHKTKKNKTKAKEQQPYNNNFHTNVLVTIIACSSNIILTLQAQVAP